MLYGGPNPAWIRRNEDYHASCVRTATPQEGALCTKRNMKDDMNKLDELFKDIKNAKLTDSERAFMRNSLEFFVAEYPARAPFSIRVMDALSNTFSGTRHTRYATSAAVMCSLVLVSGIGTSIAAADALPGDALYSVKVNFNESLEGVLATNSESKAKLHARKVTRRLEEAETLAAEGRLTPAARAEIETQIHKTANAFDAAIAEVAESADPTVVAEVQSDMEASLVGHANVLASLSTDLPESRPTLAKILATVQTRAEMSKASREGAEGEFAEGHEDIVRVAAFKKKDTASTAVNRVRAKVGVPSTPAKRSVTARSLAAPAPTEITAEQAIQVGERKLEEGEYGDALNTFQAVIRATQAAEVQIEASERLNTSIVTITATGTASSTTDTATSTEE